LGLLARCDRPGARNAFRGPHVAQCRMGSVGRAFWVHERTSLLATFLRLHCLRLTEAEPIGTLQAEDEQTAINKVLETYGLDAS
jgi:hypothetical protein